VSLREGDHTLVESRAVLEGRNDQCIVGNIGNLSEMSDGGRRLHGEIDLRQFATYENPTRG
jgi:hypothetical protein